MQIRTAKLTFGRRKQVERTRWLRW